MTVTEDLEEKTMELTAGQTKKRRNEKLLGKKVYKRQIYENQNTKAGYVFYCILRN